MAINFLLLLMFVIFAPGAALAHPSLEHISGFWPGFLHPFSGLDHILTMLAAGIVAPLFGRRAVWFFPLVPLALTVMLHGYTGFTYAIGFIIATLILYFLGAGAGKLMLPKLSRRFLFIK